MVEFGFFSLCLAFCLALYGLCTGLVGLFKPLVGIVSSARNALLGVSVTLWIAALILWVALFSHDYSVRYVFLNSASDMPPLYIFTSFWSALEGSHLLWTLTLSSVIAIALGTVSKENHIYYPGLCVAFSLVLCFMLFLNLTYSAPFTRQFPMGYSGKGMNALLQNPYMAIHPPLLFLGYSLLVVPFAYSFSALLRGELTKNWLASIRQWSLLSWAVLLTAIFLGGKWAYIELGWAGYWAWDPVENSSFIPWLSLTAALHCLLILGKTEQLPRVTLFLGMSSFAFTFLGTFITRSGVISSVHSFAESNIGPSYLAWIVLLFLLILGSIAWRGDKIMSEKAKTGKWFYYSKESLLLFTNFFFIFLLMLVLFGTLLPILVEAFTGTRISIQQPFFNAFTPWIGLSLVLLLGVGNVMHWKSGKITDPVSSILFPLLWSFPISLVLYFRLELDIKSAVVFFMVLWTAGILIIDLLYKLKALEWHGKTFLKYNRSYLGSLIAHLGFLVAVLGFSGNYRGDTREAHLNLHESVSFYGYQLTNQGLSFEREYNAQYIKAHIALKDILHEGSSEAEVIPMRSKFTNNEQWFHEVGVESTFWHDIYVVLTSFDIEKNAISLKINYNPTVKFVWTSLVLMVLGALIALSSYIQIGPREQKRGTKREEKKEKKKQIIASSFLVTFVILAALFGFSSFCFAATPPPSPYEDIASDLRCPTCKGLSILDSETPQSIAMRQEVQRLLKEDKSKEEILRYFNERYGPWILREPDSSSLLGKVIWGIPILGFIIGVLLLFFLVGAQKRKQKKLAAALRDYILAKRNEREIP